MARRGRRRRPPADCRAAAGFSLCSPAAPPRAVGRPPAPGEAREEARLDTHARDGAGPLEVVVYSDFLCPWCWNAATRLGAVEAAFAGAVALDWRSYLLRPRPRERTPEALEAFRAYTQGWRRVAEDEPRAPFQPWQGDAGPPTHSLPPHRVAKAAAALGAEPGRRMRERLFRAYFAESRDISDPAVLRALWDELGLDPAGFAGHEDPAVAQRVLAEHEEAQFFGANGVPAVRLAGQEVVIVGAQPESVYRRWFERALRSG